MREKNQQKASKKRKSGPLEGAAAGEAVACEQDAGTDLHPEMAAAGE